MHYLFGTAYYQKDRIPDNFGDNGYSNNIIVQHYRPFVDIYNIAKKDGVMALLKKPKPTPSENYQAIHE